MSSTHEQIRYNRRIIVLVSIGLAILTILLGYVGYRSYQSYKNELIDTEEKQLLMMAETIGKSLVNYMDQEMDAIDLYFDTFSEEKHLEYILDYYWNHKSDMYDGVICYDGDRNMIYTSGNISFDSDMLPDYSFRSQICGKCYLPEGRYQMYISRSFRYQGEWLNVVYAMNLSTVHQSIVAPIKIGDGGYSVVKDEELAIIMHHAKDQIGMDAVYDRSIRYPELDLSDLTEWINQQKEEDSGYRIIRSFVWDDPNLQQLRRIVAYTKIHLRGDCWIVNSTLPYAELDIPLYNMTLRILSMCGVFLIIMLLVAVYIISSYMKAAGQKKEIAYLKEINSGMELLRRKEEEIQHYQRVQSLGEMSSHIAHEFNNYLTPIMVYGEILQEEPNLDEAQVEMVQGILGVAHQAADLSRRLLDFSRQDNEVVLSSISITKDVAVAGKVLEQLTPSTVTYQMNLAEEEMYIMGRPGMMEHILLNMGKNAFQAMENDGRVDHHLTVGLEKKVEDEQEYAVLSIADDGCGIAKDAMDKLFEPFYTTKRSGKGTGLGLSVVNNLVTASGGSIQIDSKLGEGTSFFLSFPLTTSCEEKREGRGRKGIADKKVAIVDDDPQVLESLKKMLEAKGYVVHAYEHPAAVASVLQNGKGQCNTLITDYWMPSITGLELAQIVQKFDPRMRIILMSGMEDSRFEWYKKNKIIDDFVLKSEIAQRLIPLLEEE